MFTRHSPTFLTVRCNYSTAFTAFISFLQLTLCCSRCKLENKVSLSLSTYEKSTSEEREQGIRRRCCHT